MQEELLQFKLQQVWTLMDLPHGKRAIGTKWVYRNKKYERGIVIRNKARLVAQGYTQEEGIDYDEVFNPVARIEAIRLFLAYASFIDFVVYEMDVKSEFLYGKTKEEVYVCQPLGFEDPEFPDKVYKLERHYMVYIKLLELGDILLVQVYVDDIIFGSTKKELCTKFEKLMHKKFQMSSMGELTFFLGLQVTQKDDGIFISQDKYVDEILKKFGFSIVKTKSTPMETSKPLFKDAEAEDVDVHLYRSMIGSLMTHHLTWKFRQEIHNRRLSISWEEIDLMVLWIQNEMLDFGHNFMNTKIFIDNESTICIVKNLVFHSKTKHIEIRHHFIRDSYEKRLIQVIKIHTDHNVADLRTKAFDTQKPRKAKSPTEKSQSSGPIPLVADEIVIKEWEDIMERAATTASSLEAEQDNEAQIRFEAASKQSNDPPLLRVNTLGSREDVMKLKELMEFCTKLSERALVV
ncbi:putative ribonuclease H-like domain-containing protein [Tanacetum coccineum]